MPLKLSKFSLKMALSRVLFLILLVSTCPLNAETKDLFVEVAKSKLRSEPKHWGKALADINYGDMLKPVNQNGSWFLVQTKTGQEGFVHESAVTARKIFLKGSGEKVDFQADSSDIVLAGKGFNKDIEKQYASDLKSLNYSAVDKMEKIFISADDLFSFMRAGNLKIGVK